MDTNTNVIEPASRTSAKVGDVIERPTGELALAWQLYADALERNLQLKRELAASRRKHRR